MLVGESWVNQLWCFGKLTRKDFYLIASSSEDHPVSLCLTHWSLGDLDVISKMKFSILFYWLVPSDTAFVEIALRLELGVMHGIFGTIGLFIYPA